MDAEQWKPLGAVTSDAWGRTGTRGINDSQGSDKWGWVYSGRSILPYFTWENDSKTCQSGGGGRNKTGYKSRGLVFICSFNFIYFYWSKVGLPCCVKTLVYSKLIQCLYVCVCVSVCVYVCVCVCVCVFNHAHHFVTPWTVTCQASLSLEFPRQEYWSG